MGQRGRSRQGGTHGGGGRLARRAVRWPCLPCAPRAGSGSRGRDRPSGISRRLSTPKQTIAPLRKAGMGWRGPGGGDRRRRQCGWPGRGGTGRASNEDGAGLRCVASVPPAVSARNPTPSGDGVHAIRGRGAWPRPRGAHRLASRRTGVACASPLSPPAPVAVRNGESPRTAPAFPQRRRPEVATSRCRHGRRSRRYHGRATSRSALRNRARVPPVVQRAPARAGRPGRAQPWRS